jgi:phosphate:Na+ symporter
MRKPHIETAEMGALHLGILRELKAVNSHLVAAAAYPVLERNSDLSPNRPPPDV